MEMGVPKPPLLTTVGCWGCECIHFTARVRITYAVMNQEMRADHSHERRQHDRR